MWRKHETHAAETTAVKRALRAAGLTVLKVGHGTGTSYGWLKASIAASSQDHLHLDDNPYLCGHGCPACRENRAMTDLAYKVIAEETGRHGDYCGQTTVTTRAA